MTEVAEKRPSFVPEKLTTRSDVHTAVSAIYDCHQTVGLFLIFNGPVDEARENGVDPLTARRALGTKKRLVDRVIEAYQEPGCMDVKMEIADIAEAGRRYIEGKGKSLDLDFDELMAQVAEARTNRSDVEGAVQLVLEGSRPARNCSIGLKYAYSKLKRLLSSHQKMVDSVNKALFDADKSENSAKRGITSLLIAGSSYRKALAI